MGKYLQLFVITVFLYSCSKGDSTVNAPTIVVDTPSIILQNSEAGTSSVKFTSSDTWTASVTDTRIDGGWIDVNPKSGNAGEVTLTITVTANPNMLLRSASVQISSQSVSKTIKVSQPGASPALALDKAEMNLTSDAGQFDVVVTSNGPWTTSGVPDWIALTPSNGATGGSVRVTYQQNTTTSSRQTVINFANGSTIKPLSIDQLSATPQLAITPSDAQNISSAGGEVSVSVTSNTSWTASSDRTWAIPSKTTGSGNGHITVAVSANQSPTADAATITFTVANVAPVKLVINRAGASPVLSINPSTPQNIAAAGGVVSVTVSSNTAWSVSSNKLWASAGTSAGSGNGSTLITIAPNTTTQADVAQLTFTAKDTPSVKLTINRAGVAPRITIDKSNFDVGSLSGNFNLAITSNGRWTTSGVPFWLSLSSSNGMGDAAVSVNYQANTSVLPRTGVITFSNETATKTLTVVQSGVTPMLSIDPASAQHIGAHGGTIPVKILSNTTWSASSDQSWAAVGTKNGTGDGSITIVISPNMLTTSDAAQITFSAAGVTPIILVINRAAAGSSISLDKTAQSIGASAGSFSISIASNGTWNAVCADSWVSISPNGGNGNMSSRVNYDANITLSSRSTTITFTNGTATQRLTITQNGANATLSINPTTVPTVAVAGGSVSVAITSNASWTVSSNQSWATVGTVSGSGNSSTTIRLAPNNGKTTRKALITFTSGSNTTTLEISQGISQLDDFEKEEL